MFKVVRHFYYISLDYSFVIKDDHYVHNAREPVRARGARLMTTCK